jgi:hypothetical protein
MSNQQYPAPASDEAYQQVLDQSESYEQAAITAYTAGFFDGEGSITASACRHSEDARNDGYSMNKEVSIKLVKHQISGLFDAEGHIIASVHAQGSRGGHRLSPEIGLKQASEKTILDAIISRYSNIAGFHYSLYDVSDRRENRSDTEQMSVSSADGIEAFLRPLIPLLGEKRRQAKIMVNELIPAFRQQKHHTKEGFIEMMKIKERLDEQKPMSKEDRKYTVEYFKDLWADDIEAQTALSDHNGGADQ